MNDDEINQKINQLEQKINDINDKDSKRWKIEIAIAFFGFIASGLAAIAAFQSNMAVSNSLELQKKEAAIKGVFAFQDYITANLESFLCLQLSHKYQIYPSQLTNPEYEFTTVKYEDIFDDTVNSCLLSDSSLYNKNERTISPDGQKKIGTKTFFVLNELEKLLSLSHYNLADNEVIWQEIKSPLEQSFLKEYYDSMDNNNQNQFQSIWKRTQEAILELNN